MPLRSAQLLSVIHGHVYVIVALFFASIVSAIAMSSQLLPNVADSSQAHVQAARSPGALCMSLLPLYSGGEGGRRPDEGAAATRSADEVAFGKNSVQSPSSHSALSAGSCALTSRIETILLRGRVVWMAEALNRLHGVNVVPEAAESILALETAAGELHPIVEDTRGRAFRRDARLRGIELEILAQQHKGVPMLQVIQMFEVVEHQRRELDYWCDICAIAMFELKPCDCCQGDIALRRRVVHVPSSK